MLHTSGYTNSKWAGHVIRKKDCRISKEILEENLGGKSPVGRSRSRGRTTFRMMQSPRSLYGTRRRRQNRSKGIDEAMI
jgi:hypothetical protein